MNRRRFALAAMFPATFVTGCHSGEAKPSREATLFHNEGVRTAVQELDQATNALDMHLSQFNAENWQDALTNAQTSVIRLRNVVDDLKRSLGYAETS